MAIKLEDKTNVVTPDTDFPYGSIKDDTGIGDGTPISFQVYSDFHQFFAKMLASSGVVANGLPDNATNGFQYYDALLSVVKDSLTSSAVPSYSAGYIADTSYPVSIKKSITSVTIQGKTNASVPGNVTTAVGLFDLPSEFKPQANIVLYCNKFSNGDPVRIDIASGSGSVTLRGDVTPVNSDDVLLDIMFFKFN